MVRARFPFNGERQVVNIFPVQIVNSNACIFLQFINGADADGLATFIVNPDGQRGAPEAVAGDTPVNGIVQPVAHTAITNMIRYPVDLLVACSNTLLDLLHLDVPGWNGTVNYGGVGARTEWVAVLVYLLYVEFAFVLELANDVLVSFLDITAGKVRHFIGKVAFKIHWANQRRDSVLLHHTEVVLTECRGLVNDTCTGFGRDIVICHNNKGAFAFLVREERKQRFIMLADKLAAWVFRNNVEVLTFADRHEPILCEVKLFAQFIVPDFNVGDIVVDTQCQVGGQRPGGCCPRAHVSVFIFKLEEHGDSRILHILVV